MSEVASPQANRCSSCGTELAATLLACPKCQTLVHRDRLASIAAQAAAEGDRAKAAALWREALVLLPPGSKQFDLIQERIDDLTEPREVGWSWVLLSPVTLISMLISMVVYTTAWGVPIAAGLILAVYVHEMGHLIEIRRRGLRACAPVFIPGLGAFVPMKQKPPTASADARIGLAGPLFGLGATVAALLASVATDAKVWGEIANFSAVLNLFNLAPIWQLDGSRGFHAMARPQRWLVIVVIAAMLAITSERALIVVGLVALWRAFEKNVTTERDWTATAIYAGLIVAFAGLATFRV